MHHRAQKEYRVERAMFLNILRIAARFYFKTKSEEFKEYMRWISDHLQVIEDRRKNGYYQREVEADERIDKHLENVRKKIEAFRLGISTPPL